MFDKKPRDNEKDVNMLFIGFEDEGKVPQTKGCMWSQEARKVQESFSPGASKMNAARWTHFPCLTPILEVNKSVLF